MSNPYIAGQASVWHQRYGPNTKPVYMGCHAVTGLEESFGALTRYWCPDPARVGKYLPAGSSTDAPDPPSATVETSLKSVLDELEKADCRGSLFFHKVCGGRRDLFTNWERSFAMHKYHKESDSYEDLASRSPEDETQSTLSADFTAEDLLKFVELNTARQDNACVGDLLAIAACGTSKCADDCSGAKAECETLIAVGTPLTGSAADKACLLLSTDGGVTWTPAAADPFLGDEDISAVVCVELDASTNRIIVARGTTDAGNPAEIAYSDDWGVSWTLVDVGALDGQYVLESEGLFALDRYHVWLVATDGYVYFSEDAGVTWSTQEAGAATAEDLRCIMFDTDALTGYAVGDNNAVLKSQDGGLLWTLLTGPAGQATDEIYALHLLDPDHVWIGYNDGELWYTDDGGVTWGERIWGLTAGEIQDIVFVHPLEGYLIHDTAAPIGSLWRTIDGGWTWQRVLPAITNAGYNALLACGHNHVMIVGNVQGTTPVIVKASAA